MVSVIFSFDVEDFITPEADDAALRWAQLLAKHGVKGCFCVVGEKARALRKRGRVDVIEALKLHEVGYHSDTHSLHPTIAEYLEELDWDEGVDEVIRREVRGIHDVAEIFGQYPSAWIRPGNSWAPQVMVAMVLLGIPVAGDSDFEMPNGTPMRYCNSLLLRYVFAFDDYFEELNRLPRMKRDFERLVAERDGGVIVIYTHPCRLVTEQFWDELFDHGATPPKKIWRSAPLRTRETSQKILADFDQFIGYVLEKTNVKVTTFRELHDAYRETDGTSLQLPAIVALSKRIQDPLTYQVMEGVAFSPAEIFGLLAWSLASFSRKGKLSACAPLRRLIGPVCLPSSQRDSLKAAVGDFLSACCQVEDYICQFRRIPGEIRIGETEVGPGAFMDTMGRLLVSLDGCGEPSDHIFVDLKSDYPEIAGSKDFQGLKYEGSWSVFPPDFKGEHLIEVTRLQSWSAKPALRQGKPYPDFQGFEN
jgi:hypothetical protein